MSKLFSKKGEQQVHAIKAMLDKAGKATYTGNLETGVTEYFENRGYDVIKKPQGIFNHYTVCQS